MKAAKVFAAGSVLTGNLIPQPEAVDFESEKQTQTRYYLTKQLTRQSNVSGGKTRDARCNHPSEHSRCNYFTDLVLVRHRQIRSPLDARHPARNFLSNFQTALRHELKLLPLKTDLGYTSASPERNPKRSGEPTSATSPQVVIRTGSSFESVASAEPLRDVPVGSPADHVPLCRTNWHPTGQFSDETCRDTRHGFPVLTGKPIPPASPAEAITSSIPKTRQESCHDSADPLRAERPRRSRDAGLAGCRVCSVVSHI